jgi:predicted N-acetyltransferase YhbS
MFDDPATPELLRERPQDAALVDALIARAFGPGRFAKTAERLRENNRPALDLSFIAWTGGKAVGCVRLWPVTIGKTSALLLGPFAVDAAYRRQGLGAALITRACEAAAERGHALILLVGDADYFGPLGFSTARGVVLPGPVDRRRVLIRALEAGAADGVAGPVASSCSARQPVFEA